MKYVFVCVLENDEENSTKVEVVELEIMEWLKLLVNNVNIYADDAVMYLETLLTGQFSVEFNNKYTSVAIDLVSY